MTQLSGTGWGATPPANLIIAAGDVLIRQIPSPTNGEVNVARINVVSLQNSLAFKNPSFIAWWIMSGAQGSDKGLIGFTPTDVNLPGMPSQKDLANASMQLEGMFYQNIQTQDDGVEFERGSLKVANGRVLYVCVATIVDGSVSPAAALGGGPFSITVRGWDDENIVHAKLR